MRFDKTLERQVVGIYVSDHLTYECAFHFGCSSWNSCDNSSSRSPTMNNPSLFCTPGPPSTWCGLVTSSPKTIACSTLASLIRKFLANAGSALEKARQRQKRSGAAGRDGTLQIARRGDLPENIVRVDPRGPHQRILKRIASGPLRHLLLGLLSACIGCFRLTFTAACHSGLLWAKWKM